MLTVYFPCYIFHANYATITSALPKAEKALGFDSIAKAVKVKSSEFGAVGNGKLRLVMCLILQLMEDLSDCEFERLTAVNFAGKRFFGFWLLEKTPDMKRLTTRYCQMYRHSMRQKATKSLRRYMFGAVRVCNVGGDYSDLCNHAVAKLNKWRKQAKN